MEKYSTVSQFYHWTIAIIVIGLLTFTFFFADLFDKEGVKFAFMIHKSLGLTVLALMILRICSIFKQGRPAFPVSINKWERFFARFVHYCFYGLLIIMPLTGWIMSVAKNKIPRYFNLFNVPLPGIPTSDKLAGIMANTHNILAWILIVLLVVHVSAALKHQFINKNDLLRRILPSGKIRPH